MVNPHVDNGVPWTPNPEPVNTGTPNFGGIGTGGDVNMYGGGGSAHGRYNGAGGYSFFGGCAARGHPRGGDYSRNHQTRSAPGSGSANAWHRSYLGPQGMSGMVVVWEFK